MKLVTTCKSFNNDKNATNTRNLKQPKRTADTTAVQFHTSSYKGKMNLFQNIISKLMQINTTEYLSRQQA